MLFRKLVCRVFTNLPMLDLVVLNWSDYLIHIFEKKKKLEI